MNSVKRVKNIKELENKIEDKQTEGYQLASQSDRQAVLVKRNMGGFLGHLLVFLFTVWFTFGIGNLLYATVCYYGRKEELTVKLEDSKWIKKMMLI